MPPLSPNCERRYVAGVHVRGSLILLGCVSLTACTSSGSTASTRSGPSPAPSITDAPPTSTLAEGYYVNAPAGQAHWVMQVAPASSAKDAAISGTLLFAYQDGQTGLAQTFTGRLQADVMTLTFSGSGLQTATVAQGSTTTIALGSCAEYLQFIASNADCEFHKARDLAGDPG